MRKEIFAVCDPDKEYVSAFADYLSRQKMIPFDIRAFSRSETLLESLGGQMVDLLLISPELFTREVKEMQVGTAVLLTDSMESESTGEYPGVSKYQSCQEVIRKTLFYYKGGNDPKSRPAAVKRTMEIFGVFSPVGRCGKTTFALALAQILGKSGKTLYINLESYSGAASFLTDGGGGCLTDLLYYCSREEEKPNGSLLRKAAGMAEKAGRFDLIPPVKLPWDIRGATSREILTLVDVMASESEYEFLVLDIGNEVEDVLHVLERCSYIIMPVCLDRISCAKIRQFEESMRDWGADNVLEKIIKLRPPLDIPEGNGTSFLEQLECGRMGEHVRQYLSKYTSL